MPGLAHRRGQQHTYGGGCERQRDRATRSEAVHQRCRKRPDCPEEQEVDAEGEGDRRPRPMELLFERHDQHTGSRAHASRYDGDCEDHGDNDPGVMQPAREPPDLR